MNARSLLDGGNICKELRFRFSTAQRAENGCVTEGSINLTCADIGRAKDILVGLLIHELSHLGRENSISPTIDQCMAYWDHYVFLRGVTPPPTPPSDPLNNPETWIDAIQKWYSNFEDWYDDPNNPNNRKYPGPQATPSQGEYCKMARMETNASVGSASVTDGTNLVCLFVAAPAGPPPGIVETAIDTGLYPIQTSWEFRTPSGVSALLLAGLNLAGDAGGVKVLVDQTGDGIVETVNTVVDFAEGLIDPTSVIAVPQVGGGYKFYVFDDALDKIYNLADSNSDGIPDQLGSVFASSASFPELAQGSFLARTGAINSDDGADGPTKVGIRAYSVNRDGIFQSENWWSTFTDSNGDAVADSSSGIVYEEDAIKFRPAFCSAPCASETVALLYGVKDHTIQVVAEDPQGNFTDVLGSGVPPTGNRVVVTLSRPLQAGEEIIVRDVEHALDSTPYTIGPGNLPWIWDVTPQNGTWAGGGGILISGTDFGPQTQVFFREMQGGASILQGVVLSWTNTVLIVQTPGLPNQNGASARTQIFIVDPRLQEEDTRWSFLFQG
ncbi:MAG: IPT/TIG domain-containing protein [Planctomycetota bacterium]|nr:IPT/TIG domain-containing protein [Planctomycetota bacterium]